MRAELAISQRTEDPFLPKPRQWSCRTPDIRQALHCISFTVYIILHIYTHIHIYITSVLWLRHLVRSRSGGMRLSVNMATGKGLAAILRPRNLGLISRANSQTGPGCSQRSSGNHQRHYATGPLTVDPWSGCCRSQKCECTPLLHHFSLGFGKLRFSVTLSAFSRVFERVFKGCRCVRWKIREKSVSEYRCVGGFT